MQIQQNSAWAHLASFRFQIRLGTYAFLLVVFSLAAMSYFSLKEMQNLNHDSLRISESINQLFFIDKKLSDESNPIKLRSNFHEALNTDLPKLTSILASSESLIQIQSLSEHSFSSTDVIILRNLIKELVVSQQKLILKKNSESQFLLQFSTTLFCCLCIFISFLLVTFSRKLLNNIISPVQQMLLSAERLSLGFIAPRPRL